MFKKLAVGLMVVSVLTTGMSFANSDIDKNAEIEDVTISSFETMAESYTFDDEIDFLASLGITLTAEQQNQLRPLLEKAVQAQDDTSWQTYEAALQKIVGEDIFEMGMELEEEDELQFLLEQIDASSVKPDQKKIDALKKAYQHAISTDSEQAWQAYDEIAEELYATLDIEEISFEDDLEFLSSFDITLDDAQKEALEAAYNQATSVEDDTAWQAYDDLFCDLLGDDFDDEFQMLDLGDLTIADEIDYLTAEGVKLTEEQTSQLKKLFEAAQSDQSDQAWQNYEQYFSSLMGE